MDTQGSYLDKQQVGGRLRSAIEVEVTPEQPEVERGLGALRVTAEAMDDIAQRIIASIEKVTRPELASPVSEGKGMQTAVPSTILGRNLGDINDKLRNTFLALQSAAHRIEL